MNPEDAPTRDAAESPESPFKAGSMTKRITFPQQPASDIDATLAWKIVPDGSELLAVPIEDYLAARDDLHASEEASLLVGRMVGRKKHPPLPEKKDEMAQETGVRRVNVNFSQSAYDTLEELAKRKGKSMSDVLRDAIQLERWLSDSEKEGWHILLEKNGRVRELARF